MTDESFFQDLFGDPADDPLLDEELDDEGLDDEGLDDEGLESDRPQKQSEEDNAILSGLAGAGTTDESQPAPNDTDGGSADHPRQTQGRSSQGSQEEHSSELTITVTPSRGNVDKVNRRIEGRWRLADVAVDWVDGSDGETLPERGRHLGEDEPVARVVISLQRADDGSLFDFQ